MKELVLGKIIGLFRMKLDPQRGVFWRHLGEDVVNNVIHKRDRIFLAQFWEHLRQVAAIKHSEEDSGCTNCLCMKNWYRTGCPRVVSQLYDQILQGLLTMLSSLRLA